METAKIDIRKLQLLNDRINSTIEALNQVRMSVHGLTHTSQLLPNAALPYGLGPVALNPLANIAPTGFAAAPIAITPSIATGALAQNPLAMANLWTGLSHTTTETGENLWARQAAELSRLALLNQTFPFVYSTLPGSIVL